MLRIVPSRSSEGAKSYFDDALSRGDYYLEDQEMAGLWGGEAAKKIGLEGEVTREAFHLLCDNINPVTGKRLTARNHAKRRVGYDFNFHCPKTVSAVFALTQDARILKAFRASVRETMQELERDCEGRVGGKGAFVTETTGSMLWGEFVHLTSRPVDGVPDPHLHAHCFAMNATWDPKRQMWKAADFGTIKRDARYFEAGFHARFAGRLARMGYGIKRDGKGFWDIAGIPASVRGKFSRRTAEIEELARELGIVDPEALAALGAKSRQAKTKGLGMAELRRTWDSRLEPEERDAIHNASADADGSPRQPEITARGALSQAERHMFERRSVVATRELAEAALRRGVGSVSVDDVWKAVEDRVEDDRLLTARMKGREMVTTREVIEQERELLAFARDGRGACSSLVPPDYEFQDKLFHDPKKDTSEQQAAIRRVFASHDRVIDVRGGAGTGKTTLMREVACGLESAGHLVYAFAPTAEASRGVLRGEGFAGADTVARLLMDQRLQQQVRGQVLWIDEAGLLGARDMNRLFNVARAQGCRVILTGDTKQHAPVARGDALRILEEHGGVEPIEITKIQRQRVHQGREPAEIAQYRHAVKRLSEGDVKAGFGKLDRMGAVIEFDIDVAPEERYRRIAQDYLEASGGRNLKGRPNSVLAVSPTHAEGKAVTQHIREGLKQAGKIGARDRNTAQLVNLNWTEAERRDAAKYAPGQVIQFHQNVTGGIKRGDRFTVAAVEAGGVRITAEDGATRNLPIDAVSRFSVYDTKRIGLAKGDRIRITQNGFTLDKRHRLNNGSIYTIDGFTRSGDIRLNNGWVVDRNYGHLSHGFVTTSHASQGHTVDVVLIAQSGQSLPASSMEQFYVSVSRGREQVRIYTDDKDGLKDAIRRSGQRVSATELASGHRNQESEIRRQAASRPPEPSAPSHHKAKERLAGDNQENRRRVRQYRQVIARRSHSIQRRREHEWVIDRG